jgi:hypothetical protein
MPGPGKDRYHHGDLRAALIDTAAERAARATLALIESRGLLVRGRRGVR